MIKKYCKKPIVVTALEWTGYNEDEVKSFVGDKYFINSRGHLFLETLEGVQAVNIGSMIVKGLAGEFYSCRANIFFNSYDSYEE